MKKIKVGIVGEHPQNDSEALRLFLTPLANEGVQFKIVLKNFEGSHLDGDKFVRALVTESRDLDYIILVRDLDGLLSEIEKIKKRNAWFNAANNRIFNKGIFFLAIYEMEALILSDVTVLNKIYGLTMKPVGNPMMIADSKGHLKRVTDKSKKGKYDVNHALDIFKSLNFKTVYDTHKGERSFQSFADELKDKNIINFK
jgi:Domain of unknown function (DUF4276)